MLAIHVPISGSQGRVSLALAFDEARCVHSRPRVRQSPDARSRPVRGSLDKQKAAGRAIFSLFFASRR